MEKGGKLTGGPYWTQNWIEAMWRFTADRFVDFDTGTVDFEALGREEYEFRKALFFRNFKNSPRAREAFDAAADDYCKKVANGKKGGRPRKEDTTADGDIREDSQDRKSGTSANIYGPRQANNGVAPHREAGDVSATDSNDMGRVPQNGTHPRIQGGKRAAQGSMSPSPSGAAQDGKFRGSAKTQGESNTGSTVPAVCPESGDISEDRQSRRTDGSSVRGMAKVAQPSVRSVRSSRCPNSREEFHAFVADNNLHEGLAEEWYAIHEARGWVDENGNPIKNWRGALKNYCVKVEQKRKTA